MVRRALLVVCDRLAWIALGAVAGAWSATTAFTHAQPATAQPPALPAPAQQAQAAASPRVFTGEAGLVLNFIKADKTKEFEAIVEKLKDALASSDKPERQEQAKSWRVFKGAEPAAGGAALYVFIVDPPVKGADYAVTGILGEALPPEEMTQVTKQYVEAYSTGQNFVNLALVADLAK
jgi:hypothetical protein